MSYNYDAQLIDSVKVGQARIEGALLFGSDRLKRQYKRRVGTFTVSFFLAVLAAAGCVLAGWVISMFTAYQAQQQQRQSQWNQPIEEQPAVEQGAPDPLTDPSAVPEPAPDSVPVPSPQENQ